MESTVLLVLVLAGFGVELLSTYAHMFRDVDDDDGDDYVRVLTKLDSSSFPPPPDLGLLLHVARRQAPVSRQLGLHSHGGREPGFVEWTTSRWW
jgi:hypothetical protein